VDSLLSIRGRLGACATDAHEGMPYPLDRHLKATPAWYTDALVFDKTYMSLFTAGKAAPDRVPLLKKGPSYPST
jgi:hypothetical protein